MIAVLALGLVWMLLFPATLALVGRFVPNLSNWQTLPGFLAVTAIQVFWFFALLAIAAALGI